MSYLPANSPLPPNSLNPGPRRRARVRIRFNPNQNMQRSYDSPWNCGQNAGSVSVDNSGTAMAGGAALSGGNGAASPVVTADGLTTAQQQYIADAPQMVQGDTAKAICATSGREDREVNTYPRATAPWSNALVVEGQRCNGSGLLSGQVGQWVSDHPFLSLALALIGGGVILTASDK